MDDPKFQLASRYAVDLLQREMLPAFTYHNVNHTLEVANYCERLADLEGINHEGRRLLLIAAYFHDVGLTAITSTDLNSFNAKRSVHEEAAVQIACTILPEYGFEAEELETISRLIMATEWQHTPEDILEQIISDADMSSIGFATDEFMRTSAGLLNELRSFGMEIAEIDWYQGQKELLETYTYHTISARNLLDPNRLLNTLAVQSRLNMLYS
jgi:HD superfamily phosphodiesterase